MDLFPAVDEARFVPALPVDFLAEACPDFALVVERELAAFDDERLAVRLDFANAKPLSVNDRPKRTARMDLGTCPNSLPRVGTPFQWGIGGGIVLALFCKTMRLGKLLLSSLSLLACALAAPRTETGDINGAKFRIDIPDNWNGGLVMYCHGYNPKPVTYDNPKLAPALAVFLDAGYALAQSGYAAGGWAIQEALTDTENLRRHFVSKYGPVKETYVTGHSMGGFLTMALMETQPAVYDAGLPLCGPLSAPLNFVSRGAFDGRVLFDYYFPGLLPDPTHVDKNFDPGKEITEKVQAALDAAPAKAEILRRQTNIKNNKDLAGVLTFVTYVVKEIQERAGGNPFDNRNMIYTGTGDDPAVNAAVKRYAADPKAVAYVRSYYTPTGRIAKPMLAVHTVYDPLVPASIPNTYAGLTEQAGSGANFVQQYVNHDGHCTILPNEIARAFSELREWKTSGVRPNGGELKTPAQAGQAAGR